MAEREKLSKKIRFEVFKRDSFKCQYCGRSAPDVILEVDHIVPVAEGGKNDMLNLVTSCRDCNRGKGKKKLSDMSVIDKQRKQLDDLNDMREQTEMLLKWRTELMNVIETQIDACESYLIDAYGYKFSDEGRKKFRLLIKQFGFVEVIDAMEIACCQYKYANQVTSKVGGICYNRRKMREEHAEQDH